MQKQDTAQEPMRTAADAEADETPRPTGADAPAEAQDRAGEADTDVQADAALDQMRAELDAVQDRLMRTAAEYQNYRRRSEQEKAVLLALGKSEVLREMLDVVDDVDRSLEAAKAPEEVDDAEAAYRSLREGVELVHRKLAGTLQKLGVEAIEAEGQPFDENLHEAMMRQPAPEGVEPDTVVGEIQKGYRLGDRVLRHTKVIVAA